MSEQTPDYDPNAVYFFDATSGEYKRLPGVEREILKAQAEAAAEPTSDAGEAESSSPVSPAPSPGPSDEAAAPDASPVAAAAPPAPAEAPAAVEAPGAVPPPAPPAAVVASADPLKEAVKFIYRVLGFSERADAPPLE